MTLTEIPNQSEDAMLSVIVDDVARAAQKTGHSRLTFHGYTIQCHRTVADNAITISHHGQVIAENHLTTR